MCVCVRICVCAFVCAYLRVRVCLCVFVCADVLHAVDAQLCVYICTASVMLPIQVRYDNKNK